MPGRWHNNEAPYSFGLADGTAIPRPGDRNGFRHLISWGQAGATASDRSWINAHHPQRLATGPPGGFLRQNPYCTMPRWLVPDPDAVLHTPPGDIQCTTRPNLATVIAAWSLSRLQTVSGAAGQVDLSVGKGKARGEDPGPRIKIDSGRLDIMDRFSSVAGDPIQQWLTRASEGQAQAVVETSGLSYPNGIRRSAYPKRQLYALNRFRAAIAKESVPQWRFPSVKHSHVPCGWRLRRSTPDSRVVSE
jgi:hypothetical protein